MLYNKRNLQRGKGGPVSVEALACRWVITMISEWNTHSSSAERGIMPSCQVLPPNMGKSVCISSSKAWLSIEDCGANACSLAPSEWITTMETTGDNRVNCPSPCVRTGGIYQNTVWFSNRTPHLFSLEPIHFLLISHSLTYFLVSI